jgi:hypothetical protein
MSSAARLCERRKTFNEAQAKTLRASSIGETINRQEPSVSGCSSVVVIRQVGPGMRLDFFSRTNSLVH